MPDPLVLYEVDDKVSIVTLNRPEKLNAISAELQEQLTVAFARADADPATSVVLLRAQGPQLLRRLRHLGESAGEGRLAQRSDQGT
jgi:enoyl-CoA hydratase/carnithine racemase